MNEPSPSYQADQPVNTNQEPSFWQQVYRHRLSLISLAIAIISLGYNTWRNESTEAHRNTREAAFSILLELGELQQVSSYRHYFYSRVNKDDLPAHEDGDWVRGWAKVLLILDLSHLMPTEVHQAATALRDNWQAHASELEQGPGDPTGAAAEQAIMNQIKAVRISVLETLQSLQ